MFFLKKLISPLLMPMSVACVLLATGLLLLWFSRRQRLARVLVTVGAAVLLLLSYSPVPSVLVHGLESQYRPLDPATVAHDGPAAPRFIVVLGGGHGSDPALPPTSLLSGAALARLTEALRLHRALPQTKLVFSGAAGPASRAHADVMAAAAETLGLPREAMVLNREAMDTADEAVLMRGIVKDAPFILVTSALHMPRSMALFHKAGLNPRAAPADFIGKSDAHFSPDEVFPNPADIVKTHAASHELWGMLWSRLRGQL